MKVPKWVLRNRQKQINFGINAFAVDLLAESYSARRKEFKGETMCIVAAGKDKLPVYICLSSETPEGVPET